VNLRRRIALLLLLCGAAPAQAADFAADRGYQMGFSTSFSRVYIGRMATNRCLGLTVDDCKATNLRLEQLACKPHTSGIIQCLGKKKLYRGSGESIVPIGLESREFRLRDGKVDADWAVVQMVETQVLGAAPESAELRCEPFGQTGLEPCKDVTPIGALPLRPTGGPVFSREYAPEELGAISSTVYIAQYCMQSSPELRELFAPAYQRWRASRDDVAGFMETALSGTLAKKLAEPRPAGPGSETYTQCTQALVGLDSTTRKVDVRLTSPEATWKVLMAAFARGDGAAVANCFSNPYDAIPAMLSKLGTSELAAMGKTFVGFEMIDGDDEKFRRGLVTRDDGISGEVLFVKQGKEWRIEQM